MLSCPVLRGKEDQLALMKRFTKDGVQPVVQKNDDYPDWSLHPQDGDGEEGKGSKMVFHIWHNSHMHMSVFNISPSLY